MYLVTETRMTKTCLAVWFYPPCSGWSLLALGYTPTYVPFSIQYKVATLLSSKWFYITFICRAFLDDRVVVSSRICTDLLVFFHLI